MKRRITLFLFCFLLALFCLPASSRAGITGSCAAVTGGLVGWWKFDDGSGTSAVDSSGGGNTGTLQNAPAWTTGINGGALTFNGTNNWVQIPFGLLGTGPATFSAWVYPASAGPGPYLFQAGQSAFLCQQYGGSYGCSNDGSAFATTTFAPQANQWQLVTAVRDSNGKITMYVNGVQSGSSSQNAGTPATGAVEGAIGGDWSGGSNYNGTIDDVRVYNRALSASEIAQIYANNKPGDMIYNQQWRTIQYCNGGAWVSTGPPQYAAPAVHFDGSTTYLNDTSVAAAADGSSATGSFWFRRDGGTGAVRDIYDIYSSTNKRLEIYFDAGNHIHLVGNTSGAVTDLDINGGTAYTVDSLWHHAAFTFDLTQTCTSGTSNSAGCQIYVDGVAQTITETTFINGSLDLNNSTTPKNSVGGTPTGTNLYNGDLADLWIDLNQYIDLRTASNLANFYNATTNGPVYLGSTGATPDGTAPEVFLSDSTLSTWKTNKGSDGGFTAHGTLSSAGDTSSASITLLQHYANSGSQAAITLPSPTTAGSLIVVCSGFFYTPSAISASDTAGNTYTLAVGPTTNPSWYSAGCLYAINAVATSSDTITVTTTPTSSNMLLYAAEFSGIVSSNPVDTTAAAEATSATISSGSATTTNASDLIFGFCFPAGACTAGAGFTNIDTSSGNDDEYETVSAAGSQSAVFSTGASTAWIAQMIAFKNAGCASPVGAAGDYIYNGAFHVYQYCDGKNWQPMGPLPGAGGSACANPAGAEHDIIYSSNKTVMQYCDGTNWIAMGGAPIVGSTVGLVGWWKFDETSGSSASDSSGNGNTGTTHNAPAWTAGIDNGALTLNGTSHYVSVPYNSALNPAQFTVGGWASVTGGSGNYRALISSRDDGTGSDTYGYIIYAGQGGDWEFWTGTGVGGAWQVTGGGTVTLNTWTHVMAVYDGTTAYLYVNGALLASQPMPYVPTTKNELRIGAGQNEGGPNFYFPGNLDDFRVYNRALSASEVADLYHATGGL